jgi:crotonobetainyl-CoA:carnitine CoA-transferase CaiB-like acyl-CoA transferase
MARTLRTEWGVRHAGASEREEEEMGGPCEGLTVIEAGAGSMAASLVGMVLADHGAHVLKVEPSEGDRLRHLYPEGFLAWNRGKDSVVADLRTPAGVDAVRGLAAQSDVFVEAFRPGVAEQWGVGASALRRSNERLVYASIRAFASTGPHCDIPGYEGIVAAKGGWFTKVAIRGRPGPVFVNLPLANTGAAHMTVAAVLAALRVRDRTGIGQDLETSLWQGMNPFDFFGVAQWQAGLGNTVPPVTSEGPITHFPGTVCSSDGRWLVVSILLPHQRAALLRALGLEHLSLDERFSKAPHFADPDDADFYNRSLLDAFRTRTLAELTARLAAEPDIAFEVVSPVGDALHHPQMHHNDHVVTIDDPVHGPIRTVGPLARFSESPAMPTASAPPLGVHRRPARLAGTPGVDVLPPHPLAGVTIVECGYFYAMPYGCTMAAALGARVIKIEEQRGDPQRWSFGDPQSGGVHVLHGKESIALDLARPEGREIALRLAERADAFVCGFRWPSVQRMGLGWEDVRRRNPRLVYLHSAGYGHDGPYAGRAAYAPTVAAAAGSFAQLSGRWLQPDVVAGMTIDEIETNVRPHLVSMGEGDAVASLGVLSALSMALHHQARTGKGQFVSTTMLNTNVYSWLDQAQSYDGKRDAPVPDANHLGLSALYRLYPTQRGWVFLAALTQREWQTLAAIVGLTEDTRFVDAASRRDHDTELSAVLLERFATRPAVDWEAILLSAGVACVEATEGGPSAFTVTDTGLRDAGLVAEEDDPTFGRIVRHGAPATFSSTPPRLQPACLAGQHTDAILGEIGYAADQVERLVAEGTAFRA